MSENPGSPRSPLDSECLRRIEAIRLRFQAAWEAASGGSPPPVIERYLRESREPERTLLVQELSKVDQQYRRQRDGDRETTAVPKTVMEPRGREPTLLDEQLAGPSETPGSPQQTQVQETLADLPARTRHDLRATMADPERRPLVGTSGRSTPLSEGPEVPGYEILGEVGRGGMGVVYKARHIRLDRIVALKVVLAGAHAGPEQLARFVVEGQAVARLSHPGIVQVYDVGDVDGLPFISLEFVDGVSLEQLVGGKPLNPAVAAELLETLARTMQVSHEAGIVHRDLKPANVLLTTDGMPKITDFGLAKRLESQSSQTQSGTIMGSPSYMAPEQAFGKLHEIGPRTDVYSLGAILYELLTGRPPFQGTTVLDTLDQVRSQEPVPPSRLQPKVPRDLETICLKCLQKEASKRYGTALNLADDLRRFSAGEPILARPVAWPERLRSWCRRNPRVAALAASVLFLLLTITAGSVAFSIQLSEQKRATEIQRDAARVAQTQATQNARLANRQAEEARLARAKADENAAIAKKNAQLASGQMRLALEALKTLVTGVQNRLRDRPGMQDLRKSLVQVATDQLDRVAKMAEGFNISEQGPASDPDVELYLRALAGAQQRMADIYLESDQTEKALEHYQHCHEIVQKVYNDKPGDPIAIRNLAGVKNNLGDFERDQVGDMKAAMDLYRQSLDLRLEWAKLAPDDDGARQAVSNSYGLVGGVLLRLGDPAAALPMYLESQRWRETLSEQYATQVIEVQREWAGTYDKLGEVRFKLGNSEGARQNYEKALQIRRRLAEDSADTISAMCDLALSCENLGDVFLLLQNDPGSALPVYDQARQYLEDLLSKDPANTRVQSALAHALYKLATAFLKRGDAATAQHNYTKALERLEASSISGQPNAKRDIDRMLALARCGRHAEAAAMAKSLAEIGAQNAEILYQVVCGYALCAEGAEKKQKSDDGHADSAAISRKYLDLAIGALRRCVALGWKDAVTVQVDPDLDPIRGQPAFLQIVEQLKAQRPPAPPLDPPAAKPG